MIAHRPIAPPRVNTAGGRLFFVHVEVDFTVAPAEVYDADIYYVDPR
jgi:hypothetical protein